VSDLAAEHLRAEILRLYRELNQLPANERPGTTRPSRSPAYLALEAQIRDLADRYQATTHEPLVPIAAQV